MDHNEVLISADHVAKKFCRRLQRSLWYGLVDLTREATGRPRKGHLRTEEFWAIQNVSFQVRRGECLGLIGRNGAGKSTLLKMLNGLILPDAGTITMRGKVGALIELGAGFNPILTGRENILVNAAILGISKREITPRLDEIIEFAEIGDFIDAPIRTYSSGMQVRLGFSVAINMRPDILLIDEVLAVGDIAFKSKCMDKINELRESGIAIVFVSHNLSQVDRLCDRVLYLKDSQVAAFGPSREAITAYITDATQDDETGFYHHPGTEQYLQVRKVQLLNEHGHPINTVTSGAPLTIRLTFEAKQLLKAPFFNFMIEPFGRSIIAAYIFQDKTEVRHTFAPGLNTLDVHVKQIPLLAGHYRLRVSVTGDDLLHLYGKVSNLKTITVLPRPGQAVVSNQAGLVQLDAVWRIVSEGEQ